ncbi:MAG: rhodanese-like domain-containing protein [Candidatus Thorarchaeota archaeon]
MINRISINDLEQLKEKGKDFTVLDVRPKINFQTGHIDGALDVITSCSCIKRAGIQ